MLMQLLTVLFQSLAMSFATRLPLSAGLIMIESSLSASNLHCLQAQAELILLGFCRCIAMVAAQLVLLIAAWVKKHDEGFLSHESQIQRLEIVLSMILGQVGLSAAGQSLLTLWQAIARADWMQTAGDDGVSVDECTWWPTAYLASLDLPDRCYGLWVVKHAWNVEDIKDRLPKALDSLRELRRYAQQQPTLPTDDSENKGDVHTALLEAHRSLEDVYEFLGCLPALKPPFGVHSAESDSD